MAPLSCERALIEGAVTDVKGEALPGVAVSVVNGKSQATTNALGRYRIQYRPGPLELAFMKTGYTSGSLTLEVTEERRVKARTVELWRLPRNAGVFLFEDYRYKAAEPIQPKPFSSPKGGIVHGIRKLPALESTPHAKPLVIMSRMPSYDVCLCPLHIEEGIAPESVSLGVPGEPQDIWTGGPSLTLEVAPIDEPKALLLEVRLFDPLTPGVYALHWGTLDGYSNTDSRAFLFRVDGPEDSEGPAPVQEEQLDLEAVVTGGEAAAEEPADAGNGDAT